MDLADAVRAAGEGATLAIRARPRASRSAIVGLVEDGRGVAVEIALAAPPVDGAANAALLIFLSEVLGLPRKALRVARGEGSRHKLVAIDADRGAVLACLADLV